MKGEIIMENKKETPVFIKVDEYKDVIDIMQLVRTKLEDAKKALAKLNELKAQEDSELSSWQTNLDEIERKIDAVDDMFVDPESF